MDFPTWRIPPIPRQSLGYTVQDKDVWLRSHQILLHLARYETSETAHGRLLNGSIIGRYDRDLFLPGPKFFPNGELGMTVSNTHTAGWIYKLWRTVSENASFAVHVFFGNASFLISPCTREKFLFSAASRVKLFPNSQEEITGSSGGRVTSCKTYA